jgi:hypothetical protein
LHLPPALCDRPQKYSPSSFKYSGFDTLLKQYILLK